MDYVRIPLYELRNGQIIIPEPTIDDGICNMAFQLAERFDQMDLPAAAVLAESLRSLAGSLEMGYVLEGRELALYFSLIEGAFAYALGPRNECD